MRQQSLERMNNISKITQVVRDGDFDLNLSIFKGHTLNHWTFLIFELLIPFLFPDIYIS